MTIVQGFSRVYVGCLMLLCTATLWASEGSDTVFVYRNKTIHIEEYNNRVRVRIFDGDRQAYRKVYEAAFCEEQSSEKWSVFHGFSCNIPLIDEDDYEAQPPGMKAHWAGLGWGFANVSDSRLNVNDVGGVSLDTRRSTEFYFNVLEKIIPFYRNVFGITTGLGMSWHTYYLSHNQKFEQFVGATVLITVVDPVYDYSRLRTYDLSVPLLMEWQPNLGYNHSLFVTAGVVGSVNTMASFKVKYKNANGDWVKSVYGRGLNVVPLSADLMCQLGYGDFGVYAKYGLLSLFEAGKGPVVRSVSLGASLHF